MCSTTPWRTSRSSARCSGRLPTRQPTPSTLACRAASSWTSPAGSTPRGSTGKLSLNKKKKKKQSRSGTDSRNVRAPAVRSVGTRMRSSPTTRFAPRMVRTPGLTTHHCGSSEPPLSDSLPGTTTGAGDYTCKLNNSYWFFPHEVRISLMRAYVMFFPW